jgi:PiT family inorganic phosphate transporter
MSSTDVKPGTRAEPDHGLEPPPLAQQARRGPVKFWPVLLLAVLLVMAAGAVGLRSDAQMAVLILVIVIALVFDYTNGFHDAANAIATSVSTRALTPRVALIMAAVMNLIGALLGVEVAKTVSEVITPPTGLHGLTVVAAGVMGAITWNLITWYFGLPSSSSHALIGGVVGAGLASASSVSWSTVAEKVAIPMVLSPVAGFCLAYTVMVAILWIFRRAHPAKVGRRFRIAQSLSAASMALGHGLQDAQKTMGIIVLALVTTGHSDGQSVDLWVILACATALALGTYAGGWRIMRTLGRRVIELDPPKGFAAEATASMVLYATAFLWHAPISTTHTITSAIMGVGATKRLSAVRWGVAGNIVGAWVLTMPMAATVAAIVYWLVHLFGA